MPGGNVNITCVAVGSPMPYVKWMQGAEDLTPEDDMPVGRNVLELTDVKDSANYTCVAMSSLHLQLRRCSRASSPFYKSGN